MNWTTLRSASANHLCFPVATMRASPFRSLDDPTLALDLLIESTVFRTKSADNRTLSEGIQCGCEALRPVLPRRTCPRPGRRPLGAPRGPRADAGPAALHRPRRGAARDRLEHPRLAPARPRERRHRAEDEAAAAVGGDRLRADRARPRARAGAPLARPVGRAHARRAGPGRLLEHVRGPCPVPARGRRRRHLRDPLRRRRDDLAWRSPTASSSRGSCPPSARPRGRGAPRGAPRAGRRER